MKKFISLCLVLAFQLNTSDAFGKQNIPPYDREFFGGWADFDHDCQNTRHELLSELSQVPVTYSDNECRVITGEWLDPYTGRIFSDPRDVDIDHIVPLSWAWEHGAWQWTGLKRVQFSNDELNLLIVDDATNMSKGSKGPLDWLPPHTHVQCAYLVRFLMIVALYNLHLSSSESDAMHTKHEILCGLTLEN